MRKWLVETVTSCPTQSSVTGGRIFTTGSADGPTHEPEDIPDFPFIIIREGVNTNPNMPGTKVKQQTAQVWIHDAPGSMLPTDKLASELEKWLPSQAPHTNSDGVVMACEWQFTSGDGFDDHFGSTVRYVTVLVTFKEA